MLVLALFACTSGTPSPDDTDPDSGTDDDTDPDTDSDTNSDSDSDTDTDSETEPDGTPIPAAKPDFTVCADGDFADIQSAIAASAPGDWIAVCPGTYGPINVGWSQDVTI